jgi:hypothetical protein
MPTPLEKARELAAKIEAVGLDTCNSDACYMKCITLIDTALNEAMLKGAKAMQEAAAIGCNAMIHSPEVKNVRAHIEALDPQQVINEGVK